MPGSVEVVLSGFPPALLNGTLTGTVTAVRRHGGTLVPARGAIIQTRGFWRGRLLSEAPIGTQITVQLRIPGFPGDAADGIGGGPLLVRDGNPVQQADERFSLSHLNGRHPRTAVGQLADGRLIFVVADGRSSVSRGLTNWQLAQQMARLGAVTAMGLDGGGSSTLAFDGRVLNRPSDGVPRAVADGLFLFYHGIYAPKASRAADHAEPGRRQRARDAHREGGSPIRRRPQAAAPERDGGVALPPWLPTREDPQGGRLPRHERRRLALGRRGDRERERPRQHDDPQLQGEPHARAPSSLERASAGRPGASRPRLHLGRPRPAGHGRGRRPHPRRARCAEILYQGDRGRGKHVWSWDGRRAAGVLVPGGVYVVRVRATNAFGTVTLRDTVRVDPRPLEAGGLRGALARLGWCTRSPRPSPASSGTTASTPSSS